MIAWFKRLFHFHEWEELERGVLKQTFYVNGSDEDLPFIMYRCSICKKHKTQYIGN